MDGYFGSVEMSDCIVLLEECSSYGTRPKKERRKKTFEDLRQGVDTEVFWWCIVWRTLRRPWIDETNRDL